MKNENELRDLLDRLRGEGRPAQSSGPVLPGVPGDTPAAGPQKFREPALPPRPQRQERPAPVRAELPRMERASLPAGANVIWSENKEAMLFGLLASLAAALAGVLEGLNYLAMAGTVAFMLFSFVMALALFAYSQNFREKGPGGDAAGARLDQLARKLDSLEEKILSGRAGPAGGGGQVRDKELEQKVEELRKVVKSLVKAVEAGPE